MYTTLTEISRNYNITTQYIKKNYELIEGEHFIFIGNMKRFNKDKMHELLVSNSINIKTQPIESSPIMDRFLIES